ncbi:DUF2304 domain-containing protein [Patescibacteria group bacterium]|nr:DUF2304 domain-containing protein [Patescibacteria group bacterium]MBU0777363.1 DUF2304 domain-containing protein [Patescibacteria group bacterium]MBU0845991.1 DUF2304 domain-containing protein [Patescibacteria group bacterium]MBU0922539.1 DUF2304 domain-containing protein [Patescibacteria group bacterium]MBU1066528.1 DUF2304 domain-containing protein [Patescibacteria group bacterium]
MILGLQIIAIIFAFLMIYFAILHRRRGELDRTEIISWVTIWAVTIFIVIFPEILRTFAKTFFITRLFDLMIVGGFVLVIGMVTRTYVSTKRMEKKLEDYVRRESLKDVEKKSKK